MPDEFPALEAAAALGALAAAIRTYQLVHARTAIPKVAGEIGEALRRGDGARARQLSENAEGAAFTSVAEALLDTLDAADPRVSRAALEPELRRVVSDAMSSLQKRFQSGRARDLLVALVLLGAVFYATRTGIAHWALYALAAAAAVLAASGFVLRPRLFERVDRAAKGLVEDALAASQTRRSSGNEPCPVCGDNETIVIASSALGEGVTKLGVLELRVCRHCGYVQGSVQDPRSIPIGPEHGTSLSAERGSVPGDEPVEPTEHAG